MMDRKPEEAAAGQTAQKNVYPLHGGEEAAPVVTYSLYDREGRLITCRLCGEGDRWSMESHGGVFVCEHEPVPLSRGAIRQVSSVPASWVAAFEFVGLKQAPPASGAVPWIGGVGS